MRLRSRETLAAATLALILGGCQVEQPRIDPPTPPRVQAPAVPTVSAPEPPAPPAPPSPPTPPPVPQVDPPPTPSVPTVEPPASPTPPSVPSVTAPEPPAPPPMPAPPAPPAVPEPPPPPPVATPAAPPPAFDRTSAEMRAGFRAVEARYLPHQAVWLLFEDRRPGWLRPGAVVSATRVLPLRGDPSQILDRLEESPSTVVAARASGKETLRAMSARYAKRGLPVRVSARWQDAAVVAIEVRAETVLSLLDEAFAGGDQIRGAEVVSLDH